MRQSLNLYLSKLKVIIVKPEGFFLVFAIFFGVILVFLTPPLEEPDANSHFLRAYQISDLHFVSKRFDQNNHTHYGSNIPVSVNTSLKSLMGDVPGHPQVKFNDHLIKQYIGQPLDTKKTKKTVIEAAGIYSPIVYIPQAIGINLGKAFNASPLLLIWLARIVNLVVWVCVIFWAIRLLPFSKWGFVVLALNPVAVFISASLSPDVINISFAFLFVSLILSILKNKSFVSKRKLILIVAVLSVLSLSKPVNALFAALLFFIPMNRFNTKLKYASFCIGALVLSVGLLLLWNSQIKDVLDAAVYSQSGGQHISVKDQLSYIVHTPFGYLKDIIKNYIFITPGTYGDSVLDTFFGVFGWLDTTLPLWSVMLYVLCLGFAALHQIGRGIYLTLKQKYFLLGLFLVAFVGNITAMYFNATPIGSHVIAGVQGRYFIPFSVLLLGLFTGKKKVLEMSNKNMAFSLGPLLIVILGMTLFKIFLRYY